MLPLGIQPMHLIIIVVVALIIFGPQKLPEIGRGLGRALNEFRTSAREMTAGFNDEVHQPGAPVAPAPSQSMPQPVVAMPTGPTVASATVTCPNCSAANPVDAAFCSRCGTKLAASVAPPVAPITVTCPNCNAANPADATFCNHCGTKLQPVQAQPDPVTSPKITVDESAVG